MTTITAILTAYNNAAYLPEALESVLAQTRPADHIILIDDASTDATPEIAARYPVQYERLPVNSGVNAARSGGVALATGDYIAFLDADDRWLPDKLRLQADVLDTHPLLDMVFGMARQFISPELTADEAGQIKISHPVLPGYVVGGMLARRELFAAIPFPSEREMLGFFVWYAAACGRCASERLLPEIVLDRRIHRSNMTRAGVSGQYIRVLKTVLDAARRLPGLPAVALEALTTESVITASGDRLPLHAHLDEASCYVLQHFARRVQARHLVEVGFAYGISAMALATACAQCDRLEYHIIDPFQRSHWHDVGVENMRRIGFDGRYTLHRTSSELALPRLLAAGTAIEFAFIDGFHSFDHALLDFFYVNRMLMLGGIVVFDDVTYPALDKLMRYIAHYPAYRRLPLPTEVMVSDVRRALPPITRLAAFQKVDHDRREWDWFRDF